jgi:iron complex outermembrane receptor protein
LEYFTDIRQTKFVAIYAGPISTPACKVIYAPVDGFVANGGIKLKF